MILALIGNQNCGKTTLFNALTGSNQHVGNFPGVTVEQKIGTVKRTKGQEEVKIVDLPGIYSLSPYSNEEIVSRDFVLNDKPDGIINIVDASNIERNLYLTLQVLELGIPTVIALNMMDEIESSGGSVDTKKMSELLGVPVVPISAMRGEGISELKDVFIKVTSERQLPRIVDFCTDEVHRAIHAVMHLIEDHAQNAKLPKRFAATKIIEGDTELIDKLKLTDNEKGMLKHILIELEQEAEVDSQAAIADMRYSFIQDLVQKTVIKQEISKQHKASVKIDKVLTHKYFGLPIFFAIMGLVFYLSFDLIGGNLTTLCEGLIELVIEGVRGELTNFGMNPVVIGLVCDGAMAGVGSVLGFLPTIIVLFLFLSLMEDSGYMARVAYVMDRALRKIGLSGKSFVPLLIGFGCTVPAVLATRTLSSERDRKMTIMLLPFMSCTAKLPIYGFMSAIFFPEHVALITLSLYMLGMLIAILMGLVLQNTIYKGKSIPFVMELPNYRIPSFKTTMMLLYEKAKDFIVRAFTVIFAASVAIWFLQSFDIRFNLVADAEYSILASIAKSIAPIFTPLGFGNWRAATALISGFMAKEAVVSILEILTAGSSASGLMPMTTLFTPQSAYSFLVFTLIYTPCVAAFATIRKEFGNKTKGTLIALLQTVYAWVIAFVVYQLLMLFA